MAEIIQHEGKPAVYLTDHRGKKRLYLFRVERDGTTTRYIEDPTYTVTHRPGDWRCSCKAYLFSRAQYKTCKHVTCSKQIRDFLGALTLA